MLPGMPRFIAVAACIAMAGAVYGCSPGTSAGFNVAGVSTSAENDPPAPDYALDDAWLGRPDRRDNSHLVTAGTRDEQERASADVFFIHPTTYFGGNRNARYNEPGSTDTKLRSGVLRYQATVFNGCCRIYAPHYRQATLTTFLNGDGAETQRSLTLAYSDVARAFDYYIAHENHGRPFILAGHSQGSILGTRLLQEKIAGTPLMKQLVAAYLVGSSVSVENIPGIQPCRTASQTGCVIGWNSFSAPGGSRGGHIWVDGKYTSSEMPLLCTNPLNWQLNGGAPASANLGATPAMRSTPEDALPKPVPGLAGAECVGQRLVVAIADNAPGRWITLGKSYHLYDYGLFYLNIRQNATERVAAFLGKPSGK